MAIEATDHHEADDFLSALQPLAPRETIYRGQADATWHLTPKAFRSEARFLTNDGMETVEEVMTRNGVKPEMDPTHAVRRQLEINTLIGFFEAADEAGLPLPEDSQTIRATLENPLHIRSKWPAREVWSILALAQHHGLPTRLLDWTWDWRVAAYFAARDNFPEPRADRLAVWSLEARTFQWRETQRSWSRAEPPKRPYRLHVVTAPAATNTNLRAQKGLFTLLEVTEGLETGQGAPADGGRVPQGSTDPATPIEDFIEDPSLLRKDTLPTGKAGRLLAQLAIEGVTAASVFPGFDGVVRSLMERELWLR